MPRKLGAFYANDVIPAKAGIHGTAKKNLTAEAQRKMSGKPTRNDVDTFAAKILVNFGVINAAALGAALANAADLNAPPFALGLIAAIFSQIIWYVLMALEEGYDDSSYIFSPSSDALFEFILILLVVISGAFSGACIVYGSFLLLSISNFWSFLFAFLLCIVPVVLLISIAIRKGIKEERFK